MYPALAFLLLFFAGGRVPVNREFCPTPGGIPVFVVSNGFHTDLVVPVREPRTGTDWLQQLDQSQLTAQFAGHEYAAFGWGSERFYLASYGGRMPGVGTVLRAAGPGRTLMHVGFYQRAPPPGPRVVALQISEDQYRRLTTRLQQSFAPDSAGRVQLRNAAGYTSSDFFFRARGRYHALRTCNDWTAATLRRAGLRAPLKSPLAGPVLRQLRRSRAAGQAPQ